MRTSRRNAQYRKNRDKSQISFLGSSAFHENSKILSKLYEPPTQDPQSYPLIDVHDESGEIIPVLINIFSTDKIEYIYQILY